MPPPRSARRVFWTLFLGLAVVEAVVLATCFRAELPDNPAGFVSALVIVPLFVLGHVNVFPAALAAWLWRRRLRRRETG